MSDRVELLAAVDLRALLVELTGIDARGHCYPCPNPSHEQTGRTPPVSISMSGGYEVWHCHSCGIGGTAIDALMLAHGLAAAGAFDELRGRTGRSQDRQSIVATYDYTDDDRARKPRPSPAPLPTEEQVSDLHRRHLANERALSRLFELRRWTPDAIAALGIGLLDGKRITFPIRDGSGKLVNACRYAPNSTNDGESKMVSLQGRPRDLFPAPESIDGDEAWIFEGEPDAATARSLGLPAVGLPGVEFAMRLDPRRFSRFRRVYVPLDCDKSGRSAAITAAERLHGSGPEVRVVDLDPSRDDGFDLTDWARERVRTADDIPAAAAALREMAEAAAAYALEPAPDWPVIPVRMLPAFPVDALPAQVAAWVEATAEHTQTPADLPAFAALGVLSAVALGGAVVDCGAWEEELGLYLLPAMPSGDRKSTVLRAAKQPLRDLERERATAAAPRVRELRTRAEILENRSRNLIKKAAREDAASADRKEAEQELAQVGSELERIGEPAIPRLLADDATPEALGGLLSKHGAIAVLAAESAFVDNITGRYSDGKANLHLVCAAYSGEATTIDRRGRDPERRDRPLLTIALVVQPHVLEELVAHPIARAQGLVARIAYSLPETRLGKRRVHAPRVSPELGEAWAAVVSRVAKTADKTDKTPGERSSVSSVSTLGGRRIVLGQEAGRLLDELQERIEPRLAPGRDLHSIADWAGRHHGRVARTAGLLHLCEHEPSEPIGEATMLAALRIGDYLLAHGVAVLTGPDDATRRALRWLETRGDSTVSVRDLHRGPAGSRGPVERAEQLARTLEALGALRQLANSPGPGRPKSPMYAVNPCLLSGPDERDGRRPASDATPVRLSPDASGGATGQDPDALALDPVSPLDEGKFETPQEGAGERNGASDEQLDPEKEAAIERLVADYFAEKERGS